MGGDEVFNNILLSDLVPEHRLIDDEEAAEALASFGITKDQLPKIKRSDPCIKILEMHRGEEILPGSVIKVVRNSETARFIEVYRLVIGG